MASDHANHAAAAAAGWNRIQTDRGSGKNPRFVTRYEKPTIGSSRGAGSVTDAEGTSNVDQATADAAALSALNAQRRLRYGSGAGNSGKNIHGDSLTDDLN